MQDLTLNLLGFPAVNKDLTVEVRDPATQNVVRTVKPFLDGTVRIPKIDAGAYEIAVRHPNVPLPVLTRPIRVLPVGDTKVSLVIDPSKFRNTPIEDIPDANLTPVQDLVKSVAETVLPLSNKLPGEAILSRDWNTLASAVRDLANAVGELTQLISPLGHNHKELETKLDEVTGNFETLVNTISTTVVELQRQIQTQRFRAQINDVLDAAAIPPNDPRVKEFSDLVDHLEKSVTASPATFSREARNAGTILASKMETLIDEKTNADPAFATKEPVQNLGKAIDVLKTQRTTTYDAELDHLRKLDRTLGGGAIKIGLR
ncbi:MAG: hypothetical protein V7641_2806 [Blastocatellia bacterium]